MNSYIIRLVFSQIVVAHTHGFHRVQRASATMWISASMLYAAKVMAMAGFKILNEPKLAAKAKEEFDRTMNGKSCVNPIPDDIPVPNEGFGF